MTKQELEAKLAKAKKNTMLPEALRAKVIAKIEKEIKELEPEKKEKKKNESENGIYWVAFEPEPGWGIDDAEQAIVEFVLAKDENEALMIAEKKHKKLASIQSGKFAINKEGLGMHQINQDSDLGSYFLGYAPRWLVKLHDKRFGTNLEKHSAFLGENKSPDGLSSNKAKNKTKPKFKKGDKVIEKHYVKRGIDEAPIIIASSKFDEETKTFIYETTSNTSHEEGTYSESELVLWVRKAAPSTKKPDYDCNELIAKERARKASSKKSAHKSPAAKTSSIIEKVADSIEKKYKEGDLTKSQILTMIQKLRKEIKQLEQMLGDVPDTEKRQGVINITYPSISAIQAEISITKKRFNDKNQKPEKINKDLDELYEQLNYAKELKKQGKFN